MFKKVDRINDRDKIPVYSKPVQVLVFVFWTLIAFVVDCSETFWNTLKKLISKLKIWI